MTETQHEDRSELLGAARSVLCVALMGAAIGFALSSAIACLSATAAAILLARTRWRRLLAAVAAAPVLLLLGVPWPLPAVGAGALSWLVVLRHDTGHCTERTGVAGPDTLGPWSSRRLVVTAVGFSLPAGIIAHRQFSLDPLVLERPAPHLAVVVAVVCLLALLNSVGEELLWRVALLHPVRDELPLLKSALSSAVSFGLAHQSGIPGGTAGIAASGVFGFVLTLIAMQTSLRAAVAVHFVVDVAIFGAVAANVIYLG